MSSTYADSGQVTTNRYAFWFRLIALGEAMSWAGLLIAMVFKHGMGMPLGVTIMGSVHGALFVTYGLTCLVVFSPFRWRFGVLVLAGLASVPPLATVWFERWATKRGLLEIPESDEPTFWGRVLGYLRKS